MSGSGARLPPEQAYDLWAVTYDQQNDNLLMALDEELTFAGTTAADWEGRAILDFGCGTGRHWDRLEGAARLVGVDLSTGMLRRLQERHPGAEVHRIGDVSLPMLADGEIDRVLCNLMIGYVGDLAALLAEWRRVLRPGGTVLITDLHPAAQARRTFTSGGRTLEIESHPHQPQTIAELARARGFIAGPVVERAVDESTRPFFARAGALALFERMKGTPIIYRLGLTRS